MSIFSLFNKLVASTLILLTGFFGFVAAGSQTMALRDYDAAIGLLQRPAKTYSALAKIFQPVEAEANTFCVNCVNESTFNIERILNKLLRDIVLAFVKSFINFLQQQFDKLLQIVEQWANTILGIQLNLSSIRKFVALQTVKLYNQIEGSVNQFFDDMITPLQGKITSAGISGMTQALSSAAATVEVASAVEGASQNGPGQFTSNPPPNSAAIKEEIIGAATEITGALCAALGVGSSGNTDISAAAKVAGNAFIGSQCFNILPSIANLKEKLDKRSEDVKQKAKEATTDANIKPNNNNSCSSFLRTDRDLTQARNKFGSVNPVDFSSSANIDFSKTPLTTSGIKVSDFNNPVLSELTNVTFGTNLSTLSQSECDAANQTQLNIKKLEEGTKAKNAPQSEDLGAVLQQLLLDFVDSVFKALEQVITKILEAAFSAIENAISSIGIREISGPLSEAFSKAKSGVNGSISQALKDARGSIRTAITGT